MPAPKSYEAYVRARVILDKAADSPRGIIYPCTPASARRIYIEIGALKNSIRRESRKIYQPGHALYDKSPYDHLGVKEIDEGIYVGEKALTVETNSPRGVFARVISTQQSESIEFTSESDLVRFRNRCYAMRDRERKKNSIETENPLYGKSEFDGIALRKDPNHPRTLIIEIDLPDKENIIVL